MTPEQMADFRQKLKELLEIAPGPEVARKKVADFLLAKSEDEIVKLLLAVEKYLPFAKMLGF